MRPVESPSSMISSSACASSSPSSPSWTAATRSASRPRLSASCTSASTACASPSATSAAAPSSLTAALAIDVLSDDLDLANVRPGRPLITAEPRDPGVEGGEVPGQRANLANVATEESVLDRLAKQVEALPLDHAADVLLLWREDLQVQARVAVA